MHVAVRVHKAVHGSTINANLVIQNYLDILCITAADNERHLRVIYCGLFYYTVTGGRGIPEVRHSYVNVSGGEGDNPRKPQGFRGRFEDRGQRQIEERCGEEIKTE